MMPDVEAPAPRFVGLLYPGGRSAATQARKPAPMRPAPAAAPWFAGAAQTAPV